MKNKDMLIKSLRTLFYLIHRMKFFGQQMSY